MKKSLLIAFVTAIILLGLSGTASAETLNWERVATTGLNLSSNQVIYAQESFGGYLYVTTMNFSTGADAGGEIWRTADGVNWVCVVGGNAPALPNPGRGFGRGTDNGGITSLCVYDGNLYAGTMNSGVADVGAEIWRSPDGLNWTCVVGTDAVQPKGFNSVTNYGVFAMAVFNGQLYAGTLNSGFFVSGTEIWRTADGTTWNNVVGGGVPVPPNPGSGFGSWFNSDTLRLTVFNGQLYASTWNGLVGGGGTEIWRTADGTTWTCVVGTAVPVPPNPGRGFGNPKNMGVFALCGYGSSLYAGTINADDGAEIWRSADGATWERVMSGGFGSVTKSGAIFSMTVFGPHLYAGGAPVRIVEDVELTALGSEALNLLGAAGYEQLAVRAMTGGTIGTGAGAGVWRSASGDSWSQVNFDGFGNDKNVMIASLVTFGNRLYSGTGNDEGAEIWRTDGSLYVLPYTGEDKPAGSIGRLALLLAAVVIGAGALRRATRFSP